MEFEVKSHFAKHQKTSKNVVINQKVTKKTGGKNVFKTVSYHAGCRYWLENLVTNIGNSAFFALMTA